MQPTRRARLASLIQDELSRVVPREVKDPRIPSVTFTQVQVSPDGSVAKIFVMMLGRGMAGFQAPEKDANPALDPVEEEAKRSAVFRREMKECLAGLASASGYLKRYLASRLDVKHVPQLIFEEDRGLENTLRVHELLQQIAREDSGKGAAETATADISSVKDRSDGEPSGH